MFGLDKPIALFSVYPLLAVYMALECFRSREYRCLPSPSLYLTLLALGVVGALMESWVAGLDFSIMTLPALLTSVAVLAWPPSPTPVARRP